MVGIKLSSKSNEKAVSDFCFTLTKGASRFQGGALQNRINNGRKKNAIPTVFEIHSNKCNEQFPLVNEVD